MSPQHQAVSYARIMLYFAIMDKGVNCAYIDEYYICTCAREAHKSFYVFNGAEDSTLSAYSATSNIT